MHPGIAPHLDEPYFAIGKLGVKGHSLGSELLPVHVWYRWHSEDGIVAAHDRPASNGGSDATESLRAPGSVIAGPASKSCYPGPCLPGHFARGHASPAPRKRIAVNNCTLRGCAVQFASRSKPHYPHRDRRLVRCLLKAGSRPGPGFSCDPLVDRACSQLVMCIPL